MKALPTRQAESKAPVYTSLAYAELMSWSAIAAMAEERRPGLIRRPMTHSDHLDTMSAFIPRRCSRSRALGAPPWSASWPTCVPSLDACPSG